MSDTQKREVTVYDNKFTESKTMNLYAVNEQLQNQMSYASETQEFSIYCRGCLNSN